jgi:SPIRAL1-like protein
MSRAGSSGGGRSSLGYLFEPEEMFPIHRIKLSSQQATEKPSEDSIVLQDDKVTTGDEAELEPPYNAPPKREEDSNPIVSHRPASIIYHTNHSGSNSGLLITVSSSSATSDRWLFAGIHIDEFLHTACRDMHLDLCQHAWNIYESIHVLKFLSSRSRTGRRRGCGVHLEGRRHLDFSSLRRRTQLTTNN